MSEKKPYIVLKALRADSLENQVNRAIEEGYWPAGDIAVHDGYLIQPMAMATFVVDSAFSSDDLNLRSIWK